MTLCTLRAHASVPARLLNFSYFGFIRSIERLSRTVFDFCGQQIDGDREWNIRMNAFGKKLHIRSNVGVALTQSRLFLTRSERGTRSSILPGENITIVSVRNI